MLTNLFGTLSPEHTQEVRETFVHAILQTDMALHFKMVDQLKEVQALKKDVPFSKESLTERRYLLGMLLHSVDISNPLLPDFELSRKLVLSISLLHHCGALLRTSMNSWS